jgi:4-alpha-glucanotransferase
MKIEFNIAYQTVYGEELVLNVINSNAKSQCRLSTCDGLHWSGSIKGSHKELKILSYYYSVVRGNQEVRSE